MDEWECLDGTGVEGSLDRPFRLKKPDGVNVDSDAVVAESATTRKEWEEWDEWAAMKAKKEAKARKESEESEAKKTREAIAYAKSKEALKSRLILAKTTVSQGSTGRITH